MNSITNKPTVPQVLPKNEERKTTQITENEKNLNLENNEREKIYFLINELIKNINELKSENSKISKMLNESNSDINEDTSEEIKRISIERDKFKALAVEKLKDNILNDIKKEFPNITIKSIDELPEDFHRLVFAKVSPAVAYRVVCESKTAKDKSANKPALMGEINQNSESEKDYYSPAEVDKLTKKQLSNPKIMDTVMKSMLKW